ncbi:hypothetical protein SEVIR_9G560150v4 [Setaria viridis]
MTPMAASAHRRRRARRRTSRYHPGATESAPVPAGARASRARAAPRDVKLPVAAAVRVRRHRPGVHVRAYRRRTRWNGACDDVIYLLLHCARATDRLPHVRCAQRQPASLASATCRRRPARPLFRGGAAWVFAGPRETPSQRRSRLERCLRPLVKTS